MIGNGIRSGGWAGDGIRGGGWAGDRIGVVGQADGDAIPKLHARFNLNEQVTRIQIVRALQTSDTTYEVACQVAIRLNKTRVTVSDSPGFVVNRILLPMINEAVQSLAEGLATAEEIDVAMRLGANHPMGPLALADLIGLDVCLYVMETLYEQFGDSKYRPAPLLRKMVDAKYLGRKSGRGFFTYG